MEHKYKTVLERALKAYLRELARLEETTRNLALRAKYDRDADEVFEVAKNLALAL